MKLILKKYILLASLLSGIIFSFSMKAQISSYSTKGNDTYTEEEINTQKIFIEASREKLLGNYENAVVLYKEVLKRDKKNHAAAYELARMYDVLDKDEKAEKAIKMAIALDKSNQWYQTFLADLYQKMKKDKEAGKIFGKLAKQYPNNEYFYQKWAYFLVRSKQPQKAISVYDKIEQKFGLSEELIGKKHSLYLGLGKTKKATQELLKLTTAFPSNTEYKHMLASHYKRIDDPENAKKTYEEILKINPKDAQATLALANSSKDGNSETDFLALLKPIFKQKDVDIDLKIKEMIPYIQKVANTGDKNLADAAIELAKILVEVHPYEAKSFSVYGDLLNHSERPKEALEKYMKTLELDNSVFTVWEQVMYLNYELQDFDALLKTSNDALEIFPNKAKIYYLNGIANSEKHNYQDAIDAFQQALMMSAKNQRMQSDIYGRLGEVYHNMKKYQLSDKNFEKAIEISPNAYSLLDSYSFHLALRGEQLEKAKEMSKRSIELKPNEPRLLDTYGWILYKMKSYDDAKKWVGDALENGGEMMPTVLEHYGDILFQINEKDKALGYWMKAQEKGSASELLEKKIMNKRLYE
ncbi:MAG TPA: tetratricopeptide repeat protein [Phaeodactylibacter sp.]|nr:tetratricopeptide repeat protein [Phaeodactylibacter sp.]